MPRPGSTVSMCAHRTTVLPGAVAGSSAMTLPVFDPVCHMELSQRTLSPAAFSASARSVRSQVNSGSSRPKWPYAAVLA